MLYEVITHTEAAIDLARLAGLEPAGVLVEIMNEDGTMARLPELIKVARITSYNVCYTKLLRNSTQEKRCSSAFFGKPGASPFSPFLSALIFKGIKRR